VGILLIIVFSVKLRTLPASGFVSVLEDPRRSVTHLIMPALTLGSGIAASQTRYIKTAVLETMQQEYVRTAYAKGLQRNVVIWRHVVPNAAIPVVTVMGLQLASLLAGTVLTESVFFLPGLGSLVVRGVLLRDYTVVMGTVLFIVTVFVVINLLVDLLYGVLDPRIRERLGGGS
jgi:peptide/nickel transport system permease protein